MLQAGVKIKKFRFEGDRRVRTGDVIFYKRGVWMIRGVAKRLGVTIERVVPTGHRPPFETASPRDLVFVRPYYGERVDYDLYVCVFSLVQR
jgi:hypothetical protein